MRYFGLKITLLFVITIVMLVSVARTEKIHLVLFDDSQEDTTKSSYIKSKVVANDKQATEDQTAVDEFRNKFVQIKGSGYLEEQVNIIKKVCSGELSTTPNAAKIQPKMIVGQNLTETGWDSQGPGLISVLTAKRWGQYNTYSMSKVPMKLSNFNCFDALDVNADTHTNGYNTQGVFQFRVSTWRAGCNIVPRNEFDWLAITNPIGFKGSGRDANKDGFYDPLNYVDSASAVGDWFRSYGSGEGQYAYYHISSTASKQVKDDVLLLIFFGKYNAGGYFLDQGNAASQKAKFEIMEKIVTDATFKKQMSSIFIQNSPTAYGPADSIISSWYQKNGWDLVTKPGSKSKYFTNGKASMSWEVATYICRAFFFGEFTSEVMGL